MMWPAVIIFGILAVAALAAAIHEAYAAGWNASVRYHRANRYITTKDGKKLPNPFWRTYV